jgi:hypothetical protein
VIPFLEPRFYNLHKAFDLLLSRSVLAKGTWFSILSQLSRV